MKKATKVLLIGASITSTITAGITSSNAVDHKNTNIELSQKLKEYTTNYDKLKKENKKLSKRVINEINRIITLSDSVKGLDLTLKKNQLNLSNKIFLSKKINSANNTLTSRDSKLTTQTSTSKQTILEAKRSILATKHSITESYFIPEIETVPMKKKTRGGFAKTGNYKKIDGFEFNFQILNNNISNSNKKVSLHLSNPEDKTFNFTNELELSFDKKFIPVNTFVEVERNQIISGVYELSVLLDDVEIKSSTIQIIIK